MRPKEAPPRTGHLYSVQEYPVWVNTHPMIRGGMLVHDCPWVARCRIRTLYSRCSCAYLAAGDVKPIGTCDWGSYVSSWGTDQAPLHGGHVRTPLCRGDRASRRTPS